MAGIIYYLAGHCGLHPDKFKEYGLEHIKGEGYSQWAAPGPDGLPGCYFHRHGTLQKSDLVGASWHNAGRYEFAWQPENGPRAADLCRAIQFDGIPVDLGDFGIVKIPLVRRPDGETVFPQAVTGIDASGKLVKNVRPEYRELYQFAEKLWNAYRLTANVKLAGDDADALARARAEFEAQPDLLESDVFDMVCRAIGINYCIGKYEIMALSVLDTATIQKCCDAMVDLPNIVQAWSEHGAS